ncbi:stress responsive A/B barrel domain-containing protein [Polychytrium aggregatum]|uniref:stress responsive A/B barrel domain-containing protein n=1 Tax=Polychytrium aggregatum TaxID=110093 RepID=UPI0022FEDC6D|nr:stress responsive A/B barrel domain-containing protein [Polychytrium aggregatum]KAI9193228.1 stress responsive A/B barrel domain-containing protein [Polychytrium aggregatum]
MVVIHTVLLKIRKDVPQEAIDTMIREINNLHHIPGLIKIAAGENFMPERAHGYTHGLSAEFESKEPPASRTQALQGYAIHPDHVGVVTNHIRPHVEADAGVLAFDFVVPYTPKI